MAALSTEKENGSGWIIPDSDMAPSPALSLHSSNHTTVEADPSSLTQDTISVLSSVDQNQGERKFITVLGPYEWALARGMGEERYFEKS